MSEGEKKDPTCECDSHSQEAKKEERRLRHWVIKWFVRFSSFTTTLLLSAILYGYIFQERELEDDIATGLIDNVFTVIKFMFQ